MDKKLNLILNLTEGPDSRTTAEKVNDSLQEMYKTVDKIVQGSKREQEILKEQSAELQRQNELWRKRAELVNQGKSTSAIDAAGAQSVAKSRALGTELGNIRGQRAADKSQLQEQRRAWDNQTKAFEREEEKRAQSAIRAMKKQEKERDKFIRSAKGALDGLLSLAESAALAYASMMNIDDSNVKKWLQWFAAIKSVGQGISGVYQLYKSINSVIQFLTKSRIADTAATVANTAATMFNTRAQTANCAAKAACEGGSGEAAKGLLDKAKDWAGKAKGWAGKAGGYAWGALKWGARTASKVIKNPLAIGFALGEGFNLLRTGETLTGAIGSTWNARTAAQESTRRVNDMVDRRAYGQQLIARERNSWEFRLGEAERAAEAGMSQSNALSSMYGTSSTSRGMRRSAANMQSSIDSGVAAAAGLEAFAASAPAAQADQARIKATEIEISNINKILELEKQKQEIAMKTAQDELKGARAVLDISKQFEEGFKAIAEAEKASRESMVSGVLGAKKGDVRKGLTQLEKIEADESYTPSYRDAMALKRSGLATTQAAKDAIARAEEERAGKIDPRLAERLRRSRETEGEARGEAEREGALRRDAQAEVNVKQEVVVKLEMEQAKAYDNLIEQLAPKLSELVKKRDELVSQAVISQMEAAARKMAQEAAAEEVQKWKEQMEAQGR